MAGDLGGLRAFSSQLLALLSCIKANSALPEWRGKDGNEKIVRERLVIVCGWVGGGEAFVDLKEINARCGRGFRWILGRLGGLGWWAAGGFGK